jgi:hypothetical protein
MGVDSNVSVPAGAWVERAGLFLRQLQRLPPFPSQPFYDGRAESKDSAPDPEKLPW